MLAARRVFLLTGLTSLVLVVSALSACRLIPRTPTPSPSPTRPAPTAEPSPTSPPLPEVSPTPAPSPTPTAAPPVTPSPTAAPSPSPTPTPEGITAQPGALPAPEVLSWAYLATQQGEFQHTNLVSTLALEAWPSPDGRWWAVSLLQEAMEAGPGIKALYVLDTLEERHWVATTDAWGHAHYAAWLSDGRLLWVDHGDLWVANADGQNRQSLSAPETVHEFWLGADNVALVSGETVIWRLDVNERTWDGVFGIQHQTLSSPSANVGLTADGKAAVAIIQGELWWIPLEFEAPAEFLGAFSYGGREGRINPPVPLLATSPYIFPGEIMFPSDGGMPLIVLFDRESQTFVPFDDFLPEGWRSVMSSFVTPVHISPDRHWIAVPVRRGGEAVQFVSPSEAVYVAPTSDLRSGRLLAAATRVVGWNTEPAAIIVASDEGVLWVPLVEGEPDVLLPSGGPNVQALSGPDTFWLAQAERVYAVNPTNLAVTFVQLDEQAVPLASASEHRLLFAERVLSPQGSDVPFVDDLWLWAARWEQP